MSNNNSNDNLGSKVWNYKESKTYNYNNFIDSLVVFNDSDNNINIDNNYLVNIHVTLITLFSTGNINHTFETKFKIINQQIHMASNNNVVSVDIIDNKLKVETNCRLRNTLYINIQARACLGLCEFIPNNGYQLLVELNINEISNPN